MIRQARASAHPCKLEKRFEAGTLGSCGPTSYRHREPLRWIGSLLGVHIPYEARENVEAHDFFWLAHPSRAPEEDWKFGRQTSPLRQLRISDGEKTVSS